MADHTQPAHPSPMTNRKSRLRGGLRTFRIGYGVALLAVPDQVVGVAGGRDLDWHTRLFARILGARQLIEAGLVGTDHPGRRVVGSGVDAIHAGASVWFARLDPKRSRPLHANAAVAAVLGALGAVAE